jgi:hypothetical protein
VRETAPLVIYIMGKTERMDIHPRDESPVVSKPGGTRWASSGCTAWVPTACLKVLSPSCACRRNRAAFRVSAGAVPAGDH